jgi:hypothetical protein
MLLSAKKLEGYTIQARDGEIGRISNLYFEEHEWTIRYLVVDVGSWLQRQQLLLIPAAVEGIDTEERKLIMSLTLEQIKNSPDIDTKPTVEREKEMALHQYYQWQPYWNLGPVGMGDAGIYPVHPLGSATGVPGAPPAGIPRETLEHGTHISQAIREEDNEGRVALRGTAEVIDYDIEAIDGGIGTLSDLLIDDEYWYIPYLIVDTGKWLPGKKVMVSPDYISAIRWRTATIYANVDRESIEHSPAYDPDHPIWPLII